jgi:hypothetical protein
VTEEEEEEVEAELTNLIQGYLRRLIITVLKRFSY